MEGDFSSRYLGRKTCRSSAAAIAVRQCAIPKRARSSRGPSLTPEDQDLLPTKDSLTTALVTQNNIEYLLECDCALCAPHTRRRDGEDIQQAFVKSDDGLAAIGTLALAGCTFAIPVIYDHGQTSNLERFVETVESDFERELHAELFPRLADDERRDRCNNFVLAVRSKLWLFRIPRLSSQQERLRSFPHQRRPNLPFIEEEPASRDPRPGQSLVKCEIEPYYWREASIEPQRQLFRKSTVCSLIPGSKSKPEQEAEILLQLKTSKSPNIIDILFAFRELTSPNECIVHLVFPYFELNLHEYLYNRGVDEVHRLYDEGHNRGEPILGHGLWLATIDLLKAVKQIHAWRSDSGIGDLGSLNINEGLHSGVHSDIKPENIVIDPVRGRLLLSDFGNAELRHGFDNRSSESESPFTDYQYAAPERDEDTPFAHGDKPRFAFDVWSLACVLLEIIVFLAQRTPAQRGLLSCRTRAVKNFYKERYDESPANVRNAAFWKLDSSGNIVLRDVVREYIGQLATFGGPDLHRVIETITLMLDMNPFRRPTVEKCLQKFVSVGGSSHRMFLAGYSTLMASTRHNPQLSGMSTSFSTEQTSNPIACDLTLLRKESNTNILEMILDSPDVHRNDNTNRTSDALVPVSFFANDRLSEPNGQSLAAIDCNFNQLFKSTTLSFREPQDFCIFFSLMTYQRIMPANDGTVPDDLVKTKHDIHLLKCQIVSKERRGLVWKNATSNFQTTRVQVWATLSEDRYSRMYGEKLPSSQQPPSASVFKLAIFVAPQSDARSIMSQETFPSSSKKSSESSGESKRIKKDGAILMVMEIDRANVEITRPKHENTILVLSNKTTGNSAQTMPIAIITAEYDRESPSNGSGYPGVPLLPEELSRKIRDGKKLTELTLHFPSQRDRDKLVSVFKSCGVPKGIHDIKRDDERSSMRRSIQSNGVRTMTR